MTELYDDSVPLAKAPIARYPLLRSERSARRGYRHGNGRLRSWYPVDRSSGNRCRGNRCGRRRVRRVRWINSEACIDRLEALGDYRYNWSAGEQHRWQSAEWLSPAAMRERLANFSADAGSGDIYARRAA